VETLIREDSLGVFETLSGEAKRDLSRNIKFNTATCLIGAPVHMFFEHAFDVFFDYHYPVACSLLLEEAEEAVFMSLTDNVQRMVLRRHKYKLYCTEVGQKSIILSIAGFPGPSEPNRRYYSPTDNL
jgi:hypothetical protein